MRQFIFFAAFLLLLGTHSAFADGHFYQDTKDIAGFDAAFSLTGDTPHAEGFFGVDGGQLYIYAATTTAGTFTFQSMPRDLYGRLDPSTFPPGRYQVIDLMDGTTINIHNCFERDTFATCYHNTIGSGYRGSVWTFTLLPPPPVSEIAFVVLLSGLGMLVAALF